MAAISVAIVASSEVRRRSVLNRLNGLDDAGVGRVDFVVDSNWTIASIWSKPRIYGFDAHLATAEDSNRLRGMLAQSRDLEWLRLGGCGVTDSLIEDASCLRDLTHLYLEGCDIGAQSLNRLAGLRNLQELWVEFDEIGDRDAGWLENWAEARELRSLTLRKLVLRGSIFTRLPSLQIVDIADCQYERGDTLSRAFDVVGSRGRLKHVYLCPGMQAEDIRSFSKCENLASLDLSRTDISLAELPWLASAKRLWRIAIDRRNVTDVELAVACTIPDLKTLHICRSDETNILDMSYGLAEITVASSGQSLRVMLPESEADRCRDALIRLLSRDITIEVNAPMLVERHLARIGLPGPYPAGFHERNERRPPTVPGGGGVF